jgi:hypothetical protein
VNGAEELAEGAQKLRQAAFALDLRLKLARSTNTYRGWQQIPAWLLGTAGVILAFYLASKEYDAIGGWLTTALMLSLAIVAMFRGPAILSLGSGGAQEPEPNSEDQENEIQVAKGPETTLDAMIMEQSTRDG